MKHKYRILEKHYSDGSTWFLPQMGDWWHGWRYLCKSHPCRDVGWQRVAYRSFEEADSYIKDLIARKEAADSKIKNEPVECIEVKIHDYPTS